MIAWGRHVTPVAGDGFMRYRGLSRRPSVRGSGNHEIIIIIGEEKEKKRKEIYVNLDSFFFIFMFWEDF